MEAVEVDEGLGAAVAFDYGMAAGDKAVRKDEVLVGRAADGEDSRSSEMVCSPLELE